MSLALLDRDWVSASSLKTFRRCPEQWRRRYLLNEKIPPNSNLLWGSADHETAAENMRQKLGSSEDLPLPDVQEFFAADVDRRVDEVGGPSEVEWSGRDLAEKTPKQAHTFVKDRGVKLVSLYHEQVAPRLEPLSVEEEFLLDLGLGLPVKGYIDLTGTVRNGFDSEPGETRIIERKTRAPQGSKPSGDDLFQVAVYQLAKPLPADFHLSLKGAQPKVLGSLGEFETQPGPRERTLAMIHRTLRQIEQCLELYGKDEPWPDALLHPFACSYCGYREPLFARPCPWWSTKGWE